jgi:hypothetical protein
MDLCRDEVRKDCVEFVVGPSFAKHWTVLSLPDCRRLLKIPVQNRPKYDLSELSVFGKFSSNEAVRQTLTSQSTTQAEIFLQVKDLSFPPKLVTDSYEIDYSPFELLDVPPSKESIIESERIQQANFWYQSDPFFEPYTATTAHNALMPNNSPPEDYDQTQRKIAELYTHLRLGRM